MSDDDADDRPRAGGGDASDKQLNFIRVLQERVGLNDDELADVLERVAGKDVLEDLDRREASEVIDEMHVVGRDRGVDLDAQPKASDKQVGFLMSLKRRAHLTDDEFTKLLKDMGGVEDPEDLGKRDASALIDTLLTRTEGDSASNSGGGNSGGGSKPAPQRASAPPSSAGPPDADDDDVPF